MNTIIVGLGRMGSGVAKRLLQAAIPLTVMNRTPEKATELIEQGAHFATSPAEALRDGEQSTVWLYLPSGETTEAAVQQWISALSEGDILIDGGNSNHQDTKRRAAQAAERGIRYVDMGTSGGVVGAERGYCLMIGGEQSAVDEITPLLHAVAQPEGWARVGEAGAGHYVKMVHNAIEYGMMQAYAEGVALLATQEDITLPAVTEVWQHGSIITSFLGEMLNQAMQEDASLSNYTGLVSDSGEGRWALEAMVKEGVAAPVLASALFSRFSSQGTHPLTLQVLNAMRYKFGGHTIPGV